MDIFIKEASRDIASYYCITPQEAVAAIEDALTGSNYVFEFYHIPLGVQETSLTRADRLLDIFARMQSLNIWGHFSRVSEIGEGKEWYQTLYGTEDWA